MKIFEVLFTRDKLLKILTLLQEGAEIWPKKHSNILLSLPIKLRELDAGLIRRDQLINYFIGEPMALWP